MEVTKTMRPGRPGTIKLLREYGDRLLAVRYRNDPSKQQQLTTVELIVEARDLPEENVCRRALIRRQKQSVVAVKSRLQNRAQRQKLLGAKAQWDGSNKVWWLKYEKVVIMGMQNQIVEGLTRPETQKIYPDSNTLDQMYTDCLHLTMK